MNRFLLSCLLAALLLAMPFAIFCAPDVEIMESERRRSAALPKMPSKLRYREISKFFRDIDSFCADHFPLRASFLKLSMALYAFTGEQNLDYNECYRGKENWFFLGNHFARSMDKFQGKVTLVGNALEQPAEAYGKIRDAAEQCGAEFFIFLGPNKSSIYPEYLPPVVFPARQRFISPLWDALRGKGIKIYDPTDRLTSAKPAGLLYYRTDTHWNARGVYEAFEGFRAYANLPDLPPLFFTEASELNGDLSACADTKAFPCPPDNFTLHWAVPVPPFDEAVARRAGIANPHATTNKTAWVFGDSFSMALMPFLIATFKEVRLFKHGEFEAALASQYAKPDMMLWVIVERDFAHPK